MAVSGKLVLRRRRAPARRRIVRKGRKMVMRKRVPKKGGMFALRKLDVFRTSNTAGTFGGYAISSEGSVPQSCLTIGTPVINAGTNNIYDIPFAMAFKLSDVVNHTEFTNLFDQYRIAFAKVRIQAAYNTGTSSTTPIPYIDYIEDHDDQLPPPSLSGFRQKMGVKTKYFGSDTSALTLQCRPVPAPLVYQTALGSGYTVPKTAPWIDCANDVVPHFAIKGVLRNVYLANVANSSVLTWDVTLGLGFKDVQ